MKTKVKNNLYIYNNQILCGTLSFDGTQYVFQYQKDYKGLPISLTMPVQTDPYEFQIFPPFFDGLLPEGHQLEALLRIKKIDKNDYISQLAAVGKDMVGTVTIKYENKSEK